MCKKLYYHRNRQCKDSIERKIYNDRTLAVSICCAWSRFSRFLMSSYLCVIMMASLRFPESWGGSESGSWRFIKKK